MSLTPENQFHQAMLDIARRAVSEVGRRPVRFFQMLKRKGGIETANILLNAKKISDGYIDLWVHRRLDLTVEALVLQPRWRGWFTPEQLDIAWHRLDNDGYVSP